MYTQCPECNAVYRVASAHLRVAGGEVQCGACGARFDALDRLSDTYPTGLAGPVGEVPEPTGDDSTAAGTAPEADSGAESGEDSEDTGESPEAAAGAASGDEESPAEQPTEVETKGAGDSGSGQKPADDQDEPTEPALAEADVAESLSDEAETEEASEERISAVGDDDEPTIDLDIATEELFAVAELRDQELPDVGEMEFVEGLPFRQPEDAGTTDQAPPGEMVPPHPSALLRWPRRLVLPVLLLGLMVTIVHSQRGILMRQPALAPVLGGIYRIIGLNVQPAWEVAAYRIVDSAAEIDSGGDLQVTVTFVNEAQFPQPYPVLRVSLEDRWGDEIGSRELEPQEYVAGVAEGGMMPPGERVQGRATVAAPPTAAVGFRLDLCLADATNKLDCMSNQP